MKLSLVLSTVSSSSLVSWLLPISLTLSKDLARDLREWTFYIMILTAAILVVALFLSLDDDT